MTDDRDRDNNSSSSSKNNNVGISNVDGIIIIHYERPG
jgi:hypothetical protein